MNKIARLTFAHKGESTLHASKSLQFYLWNGRCPHQRQQQHNFFAGFQRNHATQQRNSILFLSGNIECVNVFWAVVNVKRLWVKGKQKTPVE